MPSCDQIHQQMVSLTSELVGLSLCSHQKFPVIRTLRGGLREVSIGDKGNLAIALKNISYHEIYAEIERTQMYNLKMLDGALIQMSYRFSETGVDWHRLAFFPSPNVEEFQNNPEIYLEEEVYAEVIERNIVPFPIRFDYDRSDYIFRELDHPKSHLSLGQYQNCRIPVSAPVTPYYFICFILRNFYHTAYLKYCDGLSVFEDRFPDSICGQENKVIHVRISGMDRLLTDPVL